MKSFILSVLLASAAVAQDDTLLIESVNIKPGADTVLVPVYLCLSQGYCFAHFNFGWESLDGKITPVGITPGMANSWDFALDTINYDTREISVVGENLDSDLKGRLLIFNLKFALNGAGEIILNRSHDERLGYCDGEGGIEPVFAPAKVRYSGVIAGDANNSGVANCVDVVFLVNYLFHGGPSPVSTAASDADGNCVVNARDITYLIAHFYGRGPGPIIGKCQ
jgi:hypothetical protein